MPRVILQGHIIVSDADMAAVIAELEQHIALTRAEPGCLVFEVVQDAAVPNKFNVYEEFEGAEQFQLHQERVRASNWGRVTAKVTRHYDIQGI